VRIPGSPSNLAPAWIQQLRDLGNQPHGPNQGECPNLRSRECLLYAARRSKKRSTPRYHVIDEQDSLGCRYGRSRFDIKGFVVDVHRRAMPRRSGCGFTHGPNAV
jgi:hypothetical protein